MSDQYDADNSEKNHINGRKTVILARPPSCIEFCPAHPDYLVVGTYDLQKQEAQRQDPQDDDGGQAQKSTASRKEKQIRNGSIEVFRLSRGKLYPVQNMRQPSAVFDLHFQPPYQGRPAEVFAAISSIGTISLYRLVLSPRPHLIRLSVLRLPNFDDNTLFTFFSWHPTIKGLMAINTAAGNVILVQIHEDHRGLDVLDESLIEHDGLEAWCVAFSNPPEGSGQLHPFTIFSGGDDSKLRYTVYDPAPVQTPKDIDMEDDDNSPTSKRVLYPSVSLGNHDAGVTFILPLPIPSDGSHLVATGSYDEHLRIWKIAPLEQTGGMRWAKLLVEERLDGGVWRLNIMDVKNVNETRSYWEILILASCMHAGPRIVRIRGTSNGAEVKVLDKFEQHESMNYGSDWYRGGVDSEEAPTIVSTSFYDKKVCVWKSKYGEMEAPKFW